MLFHYTFQQPSQKQNIRKQVYMDRKKVAFICIKEHKTCHVTLIILDKSKNIKPSRTEMCKNVFKKKSLWLLTQQMRMCN